VHQDRQGVAGLSWGGLKSLLGVAGDAAIRQRLLQFIDRVTIVLQILLLALILMIKTARVPTEAQIKVQI